MKMRQCRFCGEFEPHSCQENVPDQDDYSPSEWEADAMMAQWDDDPSPYSGDYSEM